MSAEDERVATFMRLRSERFSRYSPTSVDSSDEDRSNEDDCTDVSSAGAEHTDQRQRHKQHLKDAAWADTTWDDSDFSCWLEQNGPDDSDLKQSQSLRAPTQLAVDPLPEELHAGACLHLKCASARKGALYVHSDNTRHILPMLLAVYTYRKRDEDGTIVIVVPQGFEEQMLQEITGYCGEGTYQIKMLRSEEDYVSSSELTAYDMIVTSYSHLSNEKTYLEVYLGELRGFQDGTRATPPTDTRLCLLAGHLNGEVIKLGKYLLLDSAHELHDVLSDVYKACAALRKSFEACIMATSRPHDKDDWLGSYAYASMLEDHPLTAEHLMLVAFTDSEGDPDDGSFPDPGSDNYDRYMRFFAALTVP